MTIYAFTETHHTPPGYVNISERVAHPEAAVIIVRSTGGKDSGSLILPREELVKLRDSINDYLNK